LRLLCRSVGRRRCLLRRILVLCRRRLLRAHDRRRLNSAPAQSAGSKKQKQDRQSSRYASPVHFSPSRIEHGHFNEYPANV
jgi:hypothetical protein